jgi:DNA-binding GntR family transcriptional regulator
LLKSAPAQFDRSGLSSHTVYSALKQRIVSGELEGGVALKQIEVAKEFGVSKIPVREALRQLETENLVEFRPRRGAVVAILSAADLHDILDIRIALECRALELAIPKMVENDFLTATEILDRYSREIDVEQWTLLNLQFHQCLYAPSGNHHLLDCISELQARMGAMMRRTVSLASGLKRPHEEHCALLGACRDGQVKTAVGILRKHIETTQKEVAAHFRQQSTSLNSGVPGGF